MALLMIYVSMNFTIPLITSCALYIIEFADYLKKFLKLMMGSFILFSVIIIPSVALGNHVVIKKITVSGVNEISFRQYIYLLK